MAAGRTRHSSLVVLVRATASQGAEQFLASANRVAKIPGIEVAVPVHSWLNDFHYPNGGIFERAPTSRAAQAGTASPVCGSPSPGSHGSRTSQAGALKNLQEEKHEGRARPVGTRRKLDVHCPFFIGGRRWSPARVGAGVGANGPAVVAGTIVDAQGGSLPGVLLSLRNVDTGVLRTAVTEADGSYRFAGLPPGSYDISAELQGFATVEVKNQALTIGLELKHDITMALQSVQEAITVTGQAPIVETTRSEVAQVITQQQIETLPVNTRQTLTLALLMPGTSTDESRPRRVSVSVGAGGAVTASSFLVDGVSNQQTTGGEPRQDFPQGAIREFRVNVSQAKAEFGGTTGGVVTSRPRAARTCSAARRSSTSATRR